MGLIAFPLNVQPYIILAYKYAIAAWTLPSGAQESSNVLVFPVNGSWLAGAFYPITGIPELPKPSTGMNLPATVAAQLQKLTPEQRNQVLSQMMQQRHQLQVQRQLLLLQQQQQQLESSSASGSKRVDADHRQSRGSRINPVYTVTEKQLDGWVSGKVIVVLP